MSGRILVVAPHAMDEVLGCGGAILRRRAEGAEIRVLVLCGDGTGRDAARREASAAAARRLGAPPYAFAGLPENRSDAVPLLDVVAKIEVEIAAFAPDTVFVPHGGNLNVDHAVAWRAAITALRPVPGHPVGRILAYEIPSSTDWAPAGWGEAFRPAVFVDVAAWLDRKLEILALYEGDARAFPHARAPEAVRALAVSRGASVGLAAAEAFAAVRERV